VSVAVTTHDGRPARDAAALKAEVRHWAARIGVQPKRMQVQRMTKKWASCSTAGRICLSRELLGEERRFQDVVIVHELLHLLVPNHGKLFKSLMTAYVPSWEHVSRGRMSRACGQAE
jgi:predicted metal-dependent hydrolase